MQVAIYARVSTARQQQAQTIEQQIERLRAHIGSQTAWQLKDEHIYRDDGYSGAHLNRPGLDRLRDHARLAAFDRVLITVPDRLARTYVHQVLLIDELAKLGCTVEFLDRPMSNDPHDQLLLQIRGAVAEYERKLIADRMRRGRQAKLQSGQLLPWTRPPYGYLLDAEQPRDPARVRVDPVKAAVVQQIFAWYTESHVAITLYGIAKRLMADQVPPPRGGTLWNTSTLRNILRDTAYIGVTYSGRTRTVPARRRRSPLEPVGPGYSQAPAPEEDWIAIPVPAIITQEVFTLAQQRLEQNRRQARRNNTRQDYLLRSMVSCGQCGLSCTGRTDHLGYSYYLCAGRTNRLRALGREACRARYIPVDRLDTLVWEDLCRVLMEPALITHELERAQAGEWLPQALQARRQTTVAAIAHLERQQARLLEVYLAEVIGRAEFERKRKEVTQSLQALHEQQRQLEAHVQQQINTQQLVTHITAFCQRLQPTLEQLTFAQRRQLVELLIDRVVVTDGQVEIRYVIPTGPAGEDIPFCHLRTDYLPLLSPVARRWNVAAHP